MYIRKELQIRDRRDYVLWRRVSTKGQGESGLGLEAQLGIAKMFTGRDPVAVYTDVYSGTHLLDCVELWKAIEHCKRDDCLLVIAKTDRFRNVREALEVLDAVGEGNLSFCDMPLVNRMVLTIMFSVWESQAMMGRYNTKMALEERRRQAKESGGWVSKSGRWRTHLGPDKGEDRSNGSASRAAAVKRAKEAIEWREVSVGYNWVRRQLSLGRTPRDIITEFNTYHNTEGMRESFSTRRGGPMTDAILSLWTKEMGFRT